jgi:hypothetical protein
MVAFPSTLKSILMEKKNYVNSPCKNIIFKKSSKRNQNPSRHNVTKREGRELKRELCRDTETTRHGEHTYPNRI